MAAAVLLGAREQLEPDRIEAFVETGTIHLLVIAGLHLGILAGAVLLLAGRLPIRAALGTAGRGGVRGPLHAPGRCPAAGRPGHGDGGGDVRRGLLGRRPLGFNSLAAAALVVLAVNPAELFRAGAQLSFLCVAGLIWWGPRWIRSAGRQDPLERLIWANLGPFPRTLRQIRRYWLAICWRSA